MKYNGKMFLTSDWHFGKLSSNVEKWLPIMQEWAENWFIPLIKKEYRNGDFLVIAGDLFDDQETLNLRVKGVVDNIIIELGKILPVHIIEGNHDILDGKDSSLINPSATSSYKYFPNTYLHYSDIIEWNDKKVLLQGWVRDRKLFKEIVSKKGGDILVCHSEIRGCKRGNKIPPPLDGLEPTELSFQRVYSGHIHIRQKLSNWTFIGSPYHMDMNDLGDRKGIWILESDGTEVFIENDMSPKFLEYKVDKEEDLRNIKETDVNFNWTDLHINSSIFEECKDKMLLSKVMSYKWRRLYRFGYKIEELINENKEMSEYEFISMDKTGINKIASKKIEMIEEDNSIKTNLKNKLEQLLEIWQTNKNNL